MPMRTKRRRKYTATHKPEISNNRRILPHRFFPTGSVPGLKELHVFPHLSHRSCHPYRRRCVGACHGRGTATLRTDRLRHIAWNRNPDWRIAHARQGPVLNPPRITRNCPSSLHGMGVARKRVTIHGYRQGYPAAANDSAQNRQLNRRVEIVLPTPLATFLQR
jgi:hypothetical protein